MSEYTQDFPDDDRSTKTEEILILQLKGRKCGRCVSLLHSQKVACDQSFVNYLIYAINYTNIRVHFIYPG